MAKHRAEPSSNRFVGLAARIDADVIADEERVRLAWLSQRATFETPIADRSQPPIASAIPGRLPCHS
jgi:hypothetical protein